MGWLVLIVWILLIIGAFSISWILGLLAILVPILIGGLYE